MPELTSVKSKCERRKAKKVTDLCLSECATIRDSELQNLEKHPNKNIANPSKHAESATNLCAVGACATNMQLAIHTLKYHPVWPRNAVLTDPLHERAIGFDEAERVHT